ncbi:hypothetical protein [Peribacillus loiseleuriae]|uniref:hypothetical protein n=1 Tax=Peribacillus loiseleuriae TaxID=1679170 RepID=UPI003CFF8215
MKYVEVGNSGLLWNWSDLYHSRVAFIGSNEGTTKRLALKEIAKNIQGIDNKSVYTITSFSDMPFPNEDEHFNLLNFEKVPKGIQSESTFGITRMKFVQEYLNVLADLKREKRTDLIPLSTYQPHLEGPLAGYVKSVENLEDSRDKNWLQENFQELERIPWKYTNEHGYTYQYNSAGNAQETFLSFLKGCWSFWAMTALLEEQQDILLIIETPTNLIDIDSHPVYKKLTKDFLGILIQLSYEITCTVLISSESLYPIPELNIRHQAFWNFNSSDFDWRDNELFFSKDVVSAWKDNNNNIANWLDLAEQKKYIINVLEPLDIKLVDDGEKGGDEPIFVNEDKLENKQ